MFSPIFLFIFFLFFVSFFTLILLFSSSKFSPIPYFPSNKKDLDLILRALQLTNGQTVVDLGAGDGWVVFEAAKRGLDRKLNTKFVAVEINPLLICILHIRRLVNPNRHSIHILHADMFNLDYRQFTLDNKKPTFYLYVSPWLIPQVYKRIKAVKKARTVSYMYPINEAKKAKKLKGLHPIFIYEERH